MIKIILFLLAASVKAISFDTPIPTPFPTITPTPIPTPSSSCTIPLPTTTLVCQSPFEACKKCTDKQSCVQVAKNDDGNYNCPTFECQNCPEPVCDPPCGCSEECVIQPGHHHGQYSPNGFHHQRHFKACPIGKCKALPVCLSCPSVTCDSVRCEENYECKIKPGSCDQCPSVSCEPKPCVECPTEPVTCICPRGKECKIEERSCYKCQSVTCTDVPDPCGAGCKGDCSIAPHPNCGDCPPQRLCVEECQKCSPFLPNWTCQNPRDALYIPRTCSTCSQYRCLNECKDCSKHVPKCDCENEEDCILQPRTCDQCPTFYCKKGKL